MKFDRMVIALSTVCIALAASLPLRRAGSRAASSPEPPFAVVNWIPLLPAAPPATFNTVLREVNLEHVAFEEALKLLAGRCGAELVVDWRSLEARGLGRAAPVTVRLGRVTLGTALLAVLHQVHKESDSALACRFRKGPVLHVFAADEGRKWVTRAYDVRDLFQKPMNVRRTAGLTRYSDHLPPGREGELASELMLLLHERISPDKSAMDARGRRMIEYWSGRLIIEQTVESHEMIARLLDAFRRDGLPQSGQPPSGQ